jgi:hypothetical protein
MAKAKRERRASIRNMSGADDALEALNRLEQLEREKQAAATAPDEGTDEEPEVKEP